jgi:hypothetical protein
MTDTDARLWHPWLRINRVLRVMLHTRWTQLGDVAAEYAPPAAKLSPAARVSRGDCRYATSQRSPQRPRSACLSLKGEPT